MPFSVKVKPSGLPPQDLGTEKCHPLIVVVFCNGFLIQLLDQACQVISCVWPNILLSWCLFVVIMVK